MNYFTSDLHLNHNREFVYKERGFSSMEEHDQRIIDNINKTVGKTDYLFILGDLSMDTRTSADFDYVERLLNQINCSNVYVILGNHDNGHRINLYKDCGFRVLPGAAHIIEDNKQKYIISHYPIITNFPTNKNQNSYKNCLQKEVISLYGHMHQNEEFLNFNGIEHPLAYHIGLDSNNNFPVSMDTIREKVNDKYNEAIKKLEEDKDDYERE